jgi:uncharacterized protein YfdQ (DUF2303 family)
LRRTESWQAWRDADGKPMSQSDFAEFIMRDAAVVADLEPDTFAALAGRGAVFRIEPV